MFTPNQPRQTDRQLSGGGLPVGDPNPRGGGPSAGSCGAERGRSRSSSPLSASQAPSPACALLPPPACPRRQQRARIRGKQALCGSEEVGLGEAGGRGVPLLLLLLLADGARNNKDRQTIKRTRNVASETGWEHGGDRTPYLGSALMHRCN